MGPPGSALQPGGNEISPLQVVGLVLSMYLTARKRFKFALVIVTERITIANVNKILVFIFWMLLLKKAYSINSGFSATPLYRGKNTAGMEFNIGFKG